MIERERKGERGKGRERRRRGGRRGEGDERARERVMYSISFLTEYVS